MQHASARDSVAFPGLNYHQSMHVVMHARIAKVKLKHSYTGNASAMAACIRWWRRHGERSINDVIISLGRPLCLAMV